MRRVQVILPLLCQIYAENDQNVVYNEGVQVSEIKQIELLTSWDMLTTVTTNYISWNLI